jgi:phosphoribosylaminoimidazole carboxylase (NCAIR synthetase)
MEGIMITNMDKNKKKMLVKKDKNGGYDGKGELTNVT